jgi:hypothetical protein
MAERLGLNSSVCGFDSHTGHCSFGSVGNWQTSLTQNEACCGFESRLSHWVFLIFRFLILKMFENLKSKILLVLVEQSGVLATLSRWRSRVRIPSRTLLG